MPTSTVPIINPTEPDPATIRAYRRWLAAIDHHDVEAVQRLAATEPWTTIASLDHCPLLLIVEHPRLSGLDRWRMVQALLEGRPAGALTQRDPALRHAPLWSAALNDRADMVAQLLPWSDPNGQHRGTTALAIAARHGHLAVVNLLSPRTNPDLTDGKGRTALIHAAKNGHLACLRRLLHDHPGQNLDQQDHQGRTALNWAAAQGSPDGVSLLLRAGANPSLPDGHGWTALMHATLLGQYLLTGRLMNHHRDERAQGRFGLDLMLHNENGERAEDLVKNLVPALTAILERRLRTARVAQEAALLQTEMRESPCAPGSGSPAGRSRL